MRTADNENVEPMSVQPSSRRATMPKRQRRLAATVIGCVLALSLLPASCGRTNTQADAPRLDADQPSEILQFRAVTAVVHRSSGDWATTPLTCSARDQSTGACTGSIGEARSVVLLAPHSEGSIKYVLGPVIVDASDVVSAVASPPADVVLPADNVGWVVDVKLSADGTEAFSAATMRALGSPTRQIAIIVDGVVVSAPEVVVPIRTGSVRITGSLNERKAEALAARLNGH